MIERLTFRFYLTYGLTFLLLLAVIFARVPIAGSDYTAFLTGAILLVRNTGDTFYSLVAQGQVEQQLTGGVFKGGVLPYNQPPYISWLFVPFVGWPFIVGYYAWVIILGLLLLGLLVWIQRYYSVHLRTGLPLFIAVVLCIPPVPRAIFLGQLSIPLVLLLWWTYISWREENWIHLGVALGLAAFKLPIAIPLIVGIFVQKRWHTLLLVGATQAVLWIVSMAVIGPNVFAGYAYILNVSASNINTMGFYPAQMPNLRGILTLFDLKPTLVMNVALLGWIGSVLIAAGVWIQEKWSIGIRFTVTLVLAVLFSPHLNVHDVMLLWLALVCADVASRELGTAVNKWIFYILSFVWMVLILGLSPIGSASSTSFVNAGMTWVWAGALLLSLLQLVSASQKTTKAVVHTKASAGIGT